MNIEPLSNRIIVKQKEMVKKSKGGVILPSAADKEKPVEGVVTAVGPGKVTDEGILIQPKIKVGDMVIFSKYAGTEIRVDEENYLVFREEDIIAVIKP